MTAKSSRVAYSLPLLVLLFSSLILNLVLLKKNTPERIGTSVIGVIDGDTVVLEGKVRVRLRYIDAPEPEFCGGKEAQDALEKLVVGKKVIIEEQIPDQYGRGMAMVYEGNILVNQKMLESGWVRYHHDTTKDKEMLKAIADEVKKEGKGLFGKCQGKENIKNPTCNVKGNIDDATDEKRYYIPGCAQYAFTIVELDVGEAWFCNEKEARAAGYTKADTCK
ncbi:MAG: thermonuclease family protein [Candidatus Gottesmanbacteria bacterium]